MKNLIIIAVMLALWSAASAQPPAITQEETQTLNYEDLSDLIRRFPGMYPLDYGVLGAPVLFRPWTLAPWELRVFKDDIPQNRVSDGLYLPILDPVAELESIDYVFPSQYPAGRLDLKTRVLPVDSPYTELQIREGYYGLGTVDFAHAQRIYNSFTAEVTGRLGWYDGLRTSTGLFETSSRLNRLRGKFSYRLGSRWKTELTYEGSHDDAQTDINGRNIDAPDGYYVEREQGSFRLSETDSLRGAWAPEATIYLRQDREHWDAYRSFEMTRGWRIGATIPVPGQRLSVSHLGRHSRIVSPGIHNHEEIYLDLALKDTVDVSVGTLHTEASVRRESAVRLPEGSDWKPLTGASAGLHSRAVKNISLFGGAAYSESVAPYQWVSGNYSLIERPLPISREFFPLSDLYAGNYSVDHVRGVDRYLTSSAGIQYQRSGALLRATAMAIDRQGEFGNHFVVSPADTAVVTLGYDKLVDAASQYGISVNARIPLWYGFRVDSDWFTQTASDAPTEIVEQRSYSRLYFEHNYFKAPLIVRGHISYDYIGGRFAYSDRGQLNLDGEHLVGFRISGTIGGVTLIWGAENLLNRYYEYMPGYSMIQKEEYFAVIWKLWL